MKIPVRVLSIVVLLSNIAVAQVDTNAPVTKTGSSGLQIETRTDEERIKFLLDVGNVYFKEQDLDSAISAYERVLEIDPMNKEARYIVSHVYIQAKQYAKAEKMLMELIDEYPEDFQLKNNLAWMYATAEDPAFRHGDKAIELSQEAMALAPNDHHVWSTLSEAYYVTGHYEKAYRAINQMAKLASRYGKDITQDMVDDYNEQIRKCKRAIDTEKALKGEDATNDLEETDQDEAILKISTP